MKICFSFSFLHPVEPLKGGMDRVGYVLAEALRHRGNEVLFYTPPHLILK